MEAEWRSAEEVAAVFWLALALVKDCLKNTDSDGFNHGLLHCKGEPAAQLSGE